MDERPEPTEDDQSSKAEQAGIVDQQDAALERSGIIDDPADAGPDVDGGSPSTSG